MKHNSLVGLVFVLSAMTVMEISLLISSSLPRGLLSLLSLILPAMMYRARLEERALSEKFGSGWQDYVSCTKFIIPFLW